MICKFCGKDKALRLGGCFDCADAESIIEEGTDMWGQGMENGEPATSAGQKLKLLINRGWTKQPKNETIKTPN